MGKSPVLIMLFAIVGLWAASFVISWIATWIVKRLAVRVGFVDKPGGRKIHANPKPLGGGIAIFIAIAVPMLGALAYIHFADPPADTGGIPWRAYWSGLRQQTPIALAILGATLGLHILGLFDDRRALGA